MRIKLTVAYDGTAYVGYQSQSNGPAVQDALEKAIFEVYGQRIRTAGASRTDSGVHARGNVAVFDADTRMDASKASYALNAHLPEDIRIVESKEVPASFHPRFTDTVKTYSYTIINRRFPDPLTRAFELHWHYPLDDEAMDEAAQMLVGEHDFASFAAAGFSSNTTVRTIYEASVKRDGDRIRFTVTGNGFLYNMVRIIAGTLIEIGSGKYPPSHMRQVIEAADRKAAGPTAPAKALVLEEIRYPKGDDLL